MSCGVTVYGGPPGRTSSPHGGAVQQRAEQGAGVAAVQRAGRRTGAPVRELAVGLLHRDRLGLLVGPAVQAVVHVGVEGHGADAVRVTLGVLLTDAGAVGDAVVADPALAEGGADGVHVADDARGVHVVDERAGQVAAVLAEGAVRGPQGAEGGRAVGIEEGALVGHPIAVALHRIAEAYAARVEADDVEPFQQFGREGVGRAEGEADAGTARTTRVDQQRADAAGRVGGAVAGEGQVEGGAAGALPVHRDLDRRALEGALAGGGRAGLPDRASGGRGRRRGLWGGGGRSGE